MRYGRLSHRTESMNSAAQPTQPPMTESLFDLSAEALSSESPLTDIMISFRDVSPNLFSLIFDVFAAGEFVILVIDNPVIPIVSSDESIKHLHESEDFADAVICTSAEELAAVILPGFESWQSWAFPDSDA